MAIVLRSVDLETTGTEQSEVIETGYSDITIGEKTECEVALPVSRLFRPERGINPAAQAVHHILLENVALIKETFNAEKFCNNELIHIAHFAQHELEYLPQLKGRIICTYKVARNMWPELESYGLQYLKYALGIYPNAHMLPAHRAGPDAYVAAKLFVMCAINFMDVPSSKKIGMDAVNHCIQQFLAWTTEPLIQRRVGFGEHKGKLWTEVPDSYLQWLLFPRRPHTKPFDQEVIDTATHIKLQRRAGT